MTHDAWTTAATETNGKAPRHLAAGCWPLKLTDSGIQTGGKLHLINPDGPAQFPLTRRRLQSYPDRLCVNAPKPDSFAAWYRCNQPLSLCSQAVNDRPVSAQRGRSWIARRSDRVDWYWLHMSIPEGVRKAIIRILKPNIDNVETLTFDNGSKFFHHEMIAKTLNAKTYFAYP